MSFDYKEFEKFVDTYKKAAIEFDKFLNKVNTTDIINLKNMVFHRPVTVLSL